MFKIFNTLLAIVFFSCVTYGQTSLNMKKMASVDVEPTNSKHSDIWGYTWGNKEFAIIGSNSFSTIYDVTDCANPIQVFQWDDDAFGTSPNNSNSWRDYKDYRGYVYGVCDACNEGLQIISKDLNYQFQTTDEFTNCHNIFIDEKSGRLYAAGTSTNNRGLWVYDLNNNPRDPELLAEIDFQDWDGIAGGANWYVHDVYVRNDTAYCSHGYRGHAVWDMQDLTNIIQVGQVIEDNDGYNHSSWVHPELPYEYVAREVPAELPLEVYDNSDWSDITIVNDFFHNNDSGNSTPSTPHNPFIHTDRLFVSNYADGIKVYSLDDPINPTIEAYYDTNTSSAPGSGSYNGCWGAYPFLPSGCIVASDRETGLYTLRLTVAPRRDVEVKDVDILLSEPGAGFVFINENDEYWKLTVNNSGKFETINIGSAPTNVTEMKNANMKLSKLSAKVHMTSPNGSTWRFAVTNAGTLTTPQLIAGGGLPANLLTMEDNDVYFSQYAAGLELTSPGGNCYRVIVAGSNDIPLQC